MSLKNPFSQPKSEELQGFAGSVDIGRSYSENIFNTVGDVRGALGGTLAGAVTLPTLAWQKAHQVLGWGAGAMSGLNYHASAIIGKTNNKVFDLLAGNQK